MKSEIRAVAAFVLAAAAAAFGIALTAMGIAWGALLACAALCAAAFVLVVL